MTVRWNLLLVEDNEVDVELLQDAVAGAPGMRVAVDTTNRLSDALEYLDRRSVDLVLLDLGLPDSSGLSTFTALHAHAPDIPVLVLTALDDERLGAEAVRAGAQDYLNKQYIQTAWLLRSVEYAIERHRITRALVQSQQQLRLLAQRLERVREDERKRISREIHDELGQQLTGIKMDLRWAQRRLARPVAELPVAAIGAKMTEAEHAADEALTCVQRIALELRPTVLDNLGVSDAIRDEARRFEMRTGIPCHLLTIEDLQELGAESSTAIFRIFQELLTNVARHARATCVDVRLTRAQEDVRLEVTDDGVGIATVTPREGALGLFGMSERASSLGGWMRVEPAPGHGTRATASVPYR